MECLLSFIEINQYQNYLIENDTNNELTEQQIHSVKLENEVGFASNIPISEIKARFITVPTSFNFNHTHYIRVHLS